MAQQKNKGPVILVVIAVLALVGGGIYYVSQGSDESVTDQMQAQLDGDMETSDSVEEVETSAGDASQSTSNNDEMSDLEINAGEFIVEPGNPVVAKVDDKPITRVDVYRFIQTMPPQIQAMPASKIYPMAMEQVVNTRIIQNKANAADIMDTPEFQREMEIAKQQIARNLFMEKKVDSKISDSKVKSAFKEYVKEIPEVEERRARHILVDTESKAKAVIEKLNKGGDFSELANEVSKGPTGNKGGDLGWFEQGRMVPEFGKAVFEMEKGELRKEPVQSQFGWHVVQLDDIRNRPKPSFEEMKPMIEAQLRREALDGLFEEWRKEAKIEQYDINGKPLREGADATGLLPEEKQPQPAKQGS